MTALPRWSENPREYNKVYLRAYNVERVPACKRQGICRDCKAPSPNYTRCLGCRLARSKAKSL